MHFTTSKFWECYHRLPKDVQTLADKNYILLKNDPTHASLHLKKVGKHWSIRIGKEYRAIGVMVDRGIVWYWIGNHREYDRIISTK